MATRPELHIAVAKTKSKASDYNDNFDMMMDYCEAVALEDKTYVDTFMPTVTGQSGKFLTNNGTATSWISLTGTIFYYAGLYAPNGWLVCDGSAVSRTTYADLYSAIGTTFGEGDGSTTFNLPDLIDKFPQGNTTVGTEIDASSSLTVPCTGWGATGAGFGTAEYGRLVVGSGEPEQREGLESIRVAANDKTVTGNSVQPPALTLLPIIKY